MLPKPERLRIGSAIRRVFANGRTYAEPLLVLHVLKLPDSSSLRETGFSVSKKVGNAVTRNRVKRRLRALVAKALPCLSPGYQAMVVARPAAVAASATELANALQRVFRRAGLLVAPEGLSPVAGNKESDHV